MRPREKEGGGMRHPSLPSPPMTDGGTERRRREHPPDPSLALPSDQSRRGEERRRGVPVSRTVHTYLPMMCSLILLAAKAQSVLLSPSPGNVGNRKTACMSGPGCIYPICHLTPSLPSLLTGTPASPACHRLCEQATKKEGGRYCSGLSPRVIERHDEATAIWWQRRGMR